MAGEQLRVTEGNAQGTRLGVEADLFIGRETPHEEGKLGGDREISRRHARVSRGADGLLTIEDLRSANGTFVNGERIDAPRTLELGDSVRMGQTVLQVTDSSGAVPGAAEELVVTSGAAPGRRIPLGDELVIGRTVEGEGRMDDDRELSRRHARVARDPSGRLTIEDLGSANGTFVNGQVVRERQPLKAGDSVRVGTTTMEVTGAAGAPAPPASARPAPASAPPAPAPPQRAPARPPSPPRPPSRPRTPATPPPPPAPPTGDRPGLA